MTADTSERASVGRFRFAHQVERAGVYSFQVGLLGFVIGALYRWSNGLSPAEQTASTLGSFLVWFFAGAFVGGLFIVLPLSSLLNRRATRLASGGAAEECPEHGRQWELRTWLGWPLWAVTTGGALYLIYMLLRYGIPTYFSPGGSP